MAFIFSRLLLPTPPSLYFSASSFIILVGVSFLGLSEFFGIHVGYSKFFNSQGSQKRVKVPSRMGMFLSYTPSFLAGLASLVLLFPHHKDVKFRLLSLALTIHYFKRVFEVLFIHKYSGGMAFGIAVLISLSYFSFTANLIYFHYKFYPTHGASNIQDDINQPPIIDMKYFGVVLFLVGIIGNFYHHCLLSQLRSKGEKDMSYKIPKGGLFGLVTCPHYLFEIIEFVGISFISQTLYAFCFTIGSMFYLMARSYSTRNWYLSKFEDFPKELKALIPLVF